MRTAWILSLLCGLGCEVKESDRPCPCASGWVCCEAQDQCVPEGASCSALGGGDGGEAFDSVIPTSAPVTLGPQCELRCEGTATTLVEAPFEVGGLTGWTAGGGSATATLACDGSAIEGACDAQTGGEGLAVSQTYPAQTGTLLLRGWIQPLAAANGGGIFLRTELASDGYFALVMTTALGRTE